MTDLREAGDISTGELLDGRYRLEHRIGEGGMARVYRAHDTHLNRTTAIKVMRGPVDGRDTLERARAETKVLASLNHHSLVTVFDARISETDGSYIVMEYVDGITLRDRITSGPLEERDAALIAVDVAEALHVAHSAGIVHRDIKPSNVLLRTSPIPGRTWHAKLADFGIAFLLDTPRVTTPGLIVGTAAYIAPEQAQGAPPAPPADIYAFGIMLIEALTGTRPFADAEGIGAVMARLVSPPDIPDSLRSEWQGLLRGMTARRPDDRPTALDVATVAAKLAASMTPASEDRPTEAVSLETRPTAVLPVPGAVGAEPATVALGTAALTGAAAGAAGSAFAAGAGASAGGADPPRPGPGAGVAATPSDGAPALVESREEPEAPRTTRRRRVVAMIAAAAVLVVAIAAVLWGLALSGATPDPAPTTPVVEPSQTPTQVPPVVNDDDGDDGGGNGNQGNGNGNGNGNEGNQGNGNGNQGNQGNQGNGNGSRGNQDTETDTESGTGTGNDGEDTGGQTEAPTPSPQDTSGTGDQGSQGRGND